MMREMQLSPRLAALAEQVPEGAQIVDVGTDHAWLPLELLRKGRIASAIATDIRSGPLENARRNAQKRGEMERLSLRLGAGLSPVAPEECDVVMIAGMGGETIAQILQEAPWTKDGRHMLLLQPMTMIPLLRQFLYAAGYAITQETICREGQKWYVILAAVGTGETGRQLPLSDCYMSPALLRAQLAREYIKHLFKRETHALQGMQKGAAVQPEQLAQQEEIVTALQRALEEK